MSCEVRDESDQCTYVCLWNSKRVKIKAGSSYAAQRKAYIWFTALSGRKRVHSYDITVTLVENDGKEVLHSADF